MEKQIEQLRMRRKMKPSKKSRPCPPRPAALPSAATTSPAGNAPQLEEAITHGLLGTLAKIPGWQELLEKTGADTAALEAALRSPGVRQRLEEMATACLVLQTAEFLVQLDEAMREKDSWACKLLLELTGLAPRLSAAFASGGEPAAAALDADLDRAALEHLRELFLCSRGTANPGGAPRGTPGSAWPEES
jgi:hypothetical protein